MAYGTDDLNATAPFVHFDASAAISDASLRLDPATDRAIRPSAERRTQRLNGLDSVGQ